MHTRNLASERSSGLGSKVPHLAYAWWADVRAVYISHAAVMLCGKTRPINQRSCPGDRIEDLLDAPPIDDR